MQCLPAAAWLRRARPEAEIHFLTRSDFADVVRAFQPSASRVWSLDRSIGWLGLVRLIRDLRREQFTHIYDAHSNLRSFLVRLGLRLRTAGGPEIIRRSKNRLKRFLLFRLRKNLFPTPFRGADSYLAPLTNWLGEPPTNIAGSFDLSAVTLPPGLGHAPVVLVPGAAWPLKEWPMEHWRELVRSLNAGPVVILGGKTDTICAEICQGVGSSLPCLNLAGQISWLQCLKVIAHASVVIAGDTGLMHAADLLKRPTLALIGPTAFGFPKNPSSRVIEVTLACRPCTKDGRGRCHNVEYKACMKRIEPDRVAQAVRDIVTPQRPNAIQ